MNNKLTEHFTLQEMCRSETARRRGLPNIPLPHHITKLKNLCEQTLEPTRLHFDTPLLITSGYRCEAINRLVGGSPTSQHRNGEAADFVIVDDGRPDTPTLREVWEWMGEHVAYDQLILESRGRTRWIHVSCRLNMRKNRRQTLIINQ